jgi:hypothetical protein
MGLGGSRTFLTKGSRVPLIFENPAEHTTPIFDRLQAALSRPVVQNIRIQIHGLKDFYSLSARAHGRSWHHVGSPDELVAAFKNWLNEA